MIKLIITADDYGYNSERNQGIIDCLKNGAVTRTSVLVNGQACQCGIQLFNNLPKAPTIGLHLNLTEGSPLLKKSDKCSLTENGFFFKKDKIIHLLEYDMIEKDEIKSEIILQIEKFKEMFGYYPPYIDGHNHVHVFPVVRDILPEIMNEFKIEEVRIPEDGTEVVEQWGSYMSYVINEARNAKWIFQQRRIKFADHFFGLSTMGGDMTEPKIKKIITNIKKNLTTTPTTTTTCEFMVHPGYPCINPMHAGCGEGPDQFARSQERLHEFEILNSPSLLQFYADNDVQLISKLE